MPILHSIIWIRTIISTLRMPILISINNLLIGLLTIVIQIDNSVIIILLVYVALIKVLCKQQKLPLVYKPSYHHIVVVLITIQFVVSPPIIKIYLMMDPPNLTMDTKCLDPIRFSSLSEWVLFCALLSLSFLVQTKSFFPNHFSLLNSTTTKKYLYHFSLPY